MEFPELLSSELVGKPIKKLGSLSIHPDLACFKPLQNGLIHIFTYLLAYGCPIKLKCYFIFNSSRHSLKGFSMNYFHCSRSARVASQNAHDILLEEFLNCSPHYGTQGFSNSPLAYTSLPTFLI